MVFIKTQGSPVPIRVHGNMTWYIILLEMESLKYDLLGEIWKPYSVERNIVLPHKLHKLYILF